MKQKKYFILAVAAILMAACSENDIAEKQSPQVTTENDAVVFDAYASRGTTRAGVPGSITNTSIKQNANPHQVAGFGVFGYYTDNGTYSKYAIPDFMYNQQVTYSTSSGAWEYSPIKYWPNEFGTGAVSDHADHVSFFAYAPWVSVNQANGIPTEVDKRDKNITRLTSNSNTGDPFIKYIVDTNPATSVDLLWGVAPSSTEYSTVSGPTASTVTPGRAYTDLLKAQVNSKVNFELKHALARLNVTIDAFVDGTINTKELDSKTRIFVRSIAFSGFAMKGSLNLNNSEVAVGKPAWYDYDGIKLIPTSSEAEDVTFYDGRRDGREAADDGEQGNEKPLGLNLDIIQNSKVFNSSATPVTYATATADRNASPFVPSGVTNTTKNLFEATSATAPIFVIPTDANMNVTIVYDVETIDDNLSTVLSDGVTHGSTIENRIYKTNVFSGAIEAGKAYILNLHLGMTSVKFDASVTDWDPADSEREDVDLPHNSPGSFIPATVATQTAGAHSSLAVSVKDPSDVDVDMSTAADWDFTTTYSDNNGHSDVDIDINATGTTTGFTVDLPALADFYGRVYKVVITKVATGEKQTVNITQSAPTVTGIVATYSASTVDLTTVAPTVTPTITWNWASTTITVKDSSNSDATSLFTNNADGTLTNNSAPADTYTINIKIGDVSIDVLLTIS